MCSIWKVGIFSRNFRQMAAIEFLGIFSEKKISMHAFIAWLNFHLTLLVLNDQIRNLSIFKRNMWIFHLNWMIFQLNGDLLVNSLIYLRRWKFFLRRPCVWTIPEQKQSAASNEARMTLSLVELSTCANRVSPQNIRRRIEIRKNTNPGRSTSLSVNFEKLWFLIALNATNSCWIKFVPLNNYTLRNLGNCIEYPEFFHIFLVRHNLRQFDPNHSSNVENIVSVAMNEIANH